MVSIAKTKVIKGDSFVMEAYLDSFNKRVRIDDFRGNVKNIIRKAEEVASTIHAEKLIFKVRLEHFTEFLVHGFSCEAKLDHYFLGSDAFIFSKFYQKNRLNKEKWLAEDETVKKVLSLQKQNSFVHKLNGIILRKAELDDAFALSKIYQDVFPIYPTPLYDPDYISKTIKLGTIYYFLERENVIISAASAEINQAYKNAELTDCATRNNYQGHGYVKLLLQKLEEELKQKDIFCAYTLARAQSFGMNKAFYQLGYEYRGRLLNNCFIFERLENMNLWIKDLSC